MPLDAFQLARRQIELDRDRMRDFPWLRRNKVEKMKASPFGFLRGADPLFYEILRAEPHLAKGPAGSGWITGDLHLENFGAYRRDSFARTHRVSFDLNDFDEAVIGPWRFDVLRLATSFILAARDKGTSAPQIIDSTFTLINSYSATAMQAAKVSRPPAPVKRLVEKVRKRSRKQLLDARTKLVGRTRRLIRGKRYRSLDRELARKARRAFEEYSRHFPELEAAHPGCFDILDLAFRIAGTGSLGQLRVAVLVRGKGGPNGSWLFDMKEERNPAPSVCLGSPRIDPGTRVVRAMRACLEHPPQMIGATRLDGKSMFVRRLAPQEDRIDLSAVTFEELSDVASYFFELAGAAHRRGSHSRPTRWLDIERERLVDSALAMAGIHESTYLAFCRLSEAAAPTSSRKASARPRRG